ncbi:hypothetical protein R6Q59_034615 [Mikania micrantha]
MYKIRMRSFSIKNLIMELYSIKDAIDRVTKKQKISSSKSLETIEHISQEIQLALSGIHLATAQQTTN